MPPFLLKIAASLMGLPRWAKWALAGSIAFLVWLQFHDRAKIRDHDKTSTIKAQATASAAADDAARAIDKTKTEVEQTNDKARQDAARSDDPLRAGFDRLRAEQNAHRKPAR